MFKVSEIRLHIGYTEEELRTAVAARLNTYPQNLTEVKLLKRSIDARKKSNLLCVLSVAASVKNPKGVHGEEYFEPASRIADLGLPKKNSDKKIVVVGSGPAGYFAALTLATLGLKPLVIERGAMVAERTDTVKKLELLGVLDTETNVQFGEGGAGTFSDGKLNSGISNEYFGIIFGEFSAHGAPSDITYEAHPHVGTDYLRKVVVSMREEIIRLGGEVRAKCKLTDVFQSNGRICEIEINGTERISVDYLVLAIGHSARDTFDMLAARGVNMTAKPFSIGVRVEHPQKLIDTAQYGRDNTGLPPADYKLSAHLPSGRGVYTFCMCPGGEIICAASEQGGLVTNGMSEYARASGYANSAVLVSVTPADFPKGVLGGVEFQRKYERKAYEIGKNFRAPAQTYGDARLKRASVSLPVCTYKPSVVGADLRECLPDYVFEGIIDGIGRFDNKIKGFASENAVLIGVESRSSSPVKILRGENFEANIGGLYPCGEGAGYAGGITSSAVDGLKAALEIYKVI